MKNLAIIPARSGSKGLKDKNIKLLNGKPLLAYSIEAAIESKMFDTIMVSTDSLEYADIAMKYGADVPFLRSLEMSSDKASSWDTVKEVLSNYKKQGFQFDTVCLLQPTSPLRTPNDIKDGYKILDEKDCDGVTSVCEVDHSPLWMNTLPKNLCMDEFLNPDIVNLGRQSLQTYYRINGALYIRKIKISNSKISILDKKQFALIMDKCKSIDIDTDLDFKFAEFLMQNSII